MYGKIFKKKLKAMEEIAPGAKPVIVGKKSMTHAMKSMEPEMEEDEMEEDEMEEGSLSEKDKGKFKGMTPQTKLEIEFTIQNGKKKKGK
jgi:hypothetical protein